MASSASRPTVLVAESDLGVSHSIASYLANEGFACNTAYDEAEALDRVRGTRSDLMILDAMLPHFGGFHLCRLVRADPAIAEIPIIVISSVGDEIERVVAFELGADDYVQKPFSHRELILRIRAILRRAAHAEVVSQACWRLGTLEVDGARHEVRVNGSTVRLTTTEFKLLNVLLAGSGRTQHREVLLREVWGHRASELSRTLDTHIARLRAKLGDAADMVEAVRGFGYRLKVSDCSDAAPLFPRPRSA